jgi:hypothetical protein
VAVSDMGVAFSSECYAASPWPVLVATEVVALVFVVDRPAWPAFTATRAVPRPMRLSSTARKPGHRLPWIGLQLLKEAASRLIAPGRWP